jgi:5-methyltetrahydrofolate--homocysteine methyltransferase
MAELEKIRDLIGGTPYRGQDAEVEKLTREALDEGMSAKDIFYVALIAGMQIVIDKFKRNEFYIPEVLVCSRAYEAGMKLVKPMLADSGVNPIGTVVIGTVKGDLHDIGKNLVGMTLRGQNFNVVDLGIDVDPEKYVEAVKEHKAQLVGLSALLTTTMPQMKNVIEALKQAGLRESVKVMIGGAPITQSYADEIGADGYAPDAGTATDKAKELLGAQ